MTSLPPRGKRGRPPAAPSPAPTTPTTETPPPAAEKAVEKPSGSQPEPAKGDGGHVPSPSPAGVADERPINFPKQLPDEPKKGAKVTTAAEPTSGAAADDDFTFGL